MKVNFNKLINDWCQRPERAFFISTGRTKKRYFGCVSVCQRPERAFFISTGLNVILLAYWISRCQRPERAFFISTNLILMTMEKHTICVNALNGLFSFLQYKRCLSWGGKVCQRPERAFFISTVKKREKTFELTNVSTPWTGFFHFYYLCISYRNGIFRRCVNALNGLFSFLHTTMKYDFVSDIIVSTPWTGFFHFYFGKNS